MLPVAAPRNGAAGPISSPKRLMPPPPNKKLLPAPAGGEKKLGWIAGSGPGDRMIRNVGSRPPELREELASCSMAARRAAGESWVVLTPKIGTTKVFWAIWTDRLDLSYEPVRPV